MGSTSRSASSPSIRSPPGSTPVASWRWGSTPAPTARSCWPTRAISASAAQRARGEEYEGFIDAYVTAASERFPNAILHWEDFAAPTARAILARYGETHCTFDDDIQGTASIGLACALAGVKVSGGRLTDQQIVVFGAGAAGVGIADLLAHAMADDGLEPAAAAGRIWLLDRPGLLTSDLDGLADYQLPYVKDPAIVADWRSDDGTLGLAEVVDHLHPTMLVGTSGVTGAFSENVIRSMHEHCPRPIVLPMSNPTPLAEQTPQNVIEWTDGQALVATGSPFGPVDVQRPDLPDRPGQQRPDVPRPRPRDDRREGIDHAGGPLPGRRPRDRRPG